MIPFFAFTLPVLLVFVGLVVDVGQLELTKLKMQNAADAAALGAQVAHDAEDISWVSQGVSDAKLNGFDVSNSSNATTVVITEEPYAAVPDAFYSNYYDVAQARITQSEFTFFIGLFSGGGYSVSATAAAIFSPCAYFMSTGTSSHEPAYSLWLNGGSSIGYFGSSTQATNQLGCTLYLGKSLLMNGSGPPSVVFANATDIVGSSGASTLTNVAHPPRFNATQVQDPLAYETQPSAGSCSATGKTISNASGTITLNPGTYCANVICGVPTIVGNTVSPTSNPCGGLTIVNSTVQFNPGLYVIEGGAYWNGGTLTASGGVTFFFTRSSAANSYGTFLSTSTNMNISAPKSSSGGALAGILFMNDRNWVASSAQDFQFINFAGGTNCSIGDGIYYLTNTGLTIDLCNFGGVNYLGFDVDNLQIQYSAVVPMSNFTGLSGGNPFPQSAGVVQ